MSCLTRSAGPSTDCGRMSAISLAILAGSDARRRRVDLLYRVQAFPGEAAKSAESEGAGCGFVLKGLRHLFAKYYRWGRGIPR
jgi:hypothetical protein